jgi:RNA polymerase sigma factor (sigma-70 family)
MGSDMAGWVGVAARTMLRASACIVLGVSATAASRASARRLKLHGTGMAVSDWSALMAAAQSGDAAAYHRLLTEAAARLRRYFDRRLPPGTVDDAVQDTLLAVHQKRHTYDPARPFEHWLMAVARHKWIDRLRAMRSAPTEALNEDIPVADHGDAVTSAWTLEALLRDLRPAQAEVIRLVKLQGHSIEEAAARTGQSVSLVKVNIHRGLGRLASLVQRQRDGE